MPGLYAGIAFPFGDTLKSYFAPKSDRDVLRTSIQTILFTRMRERVMLPGFGSPMNEAPFEPSDDILSERVRGILVDTVPYWDARLEVVDAGVFRDDENHTLTAFVTYRDRALANSEDRFTFSVPDDIVASIS